MVPKGWSESYLGEVVTYKKGYAFNSSLYTEEGIRIVRISDTTRDSIHSDNPVFIAGGNVEGLEQYILFENDIILSTVGSRPHLLDSMVGKAVKVPRSAHNSLLNQNLVKLIPKKTKITNEYLFSMLKKKEFIQFISNLVRGNANQVSITLADLFKYKFILPSLPEQNKITQILSTWNKAISVTEKFLANSRQQKKALMQQLLTGKKRLLDENGVRFSEQWKEITLGNIARITTGNSNRQDSSLDGKYTFFDRSEDIRTSSIYLFDSEAIIVPGEGQKFVPKHFIGKFDLHQRTYAIMDFDGYCGKFLFYMIDFNKSYFLSQAVGSTVKSLRLPMFQKMVFYSPDFKEQQKIAAVLSAADAEISTLEKKLASLKDEKKALMQQLLTGKRRVKVEAEEAVSA